ncbi:unnamed protein product [Clavelina lepadiformis]|uniref:Peroxin-7 n=1 Tax=Clavelina lepadiformis TaxID=159417 RepID=A0ABP0EXI6_CLALP
MSTFQTHGLHGYSVKFSPFSPNLLACVACQQYGISGNAALLIAEFDPELNLPVKIVHSAPAPDGLFDVAWSELDPTVCCTASGDGTVLVWNITKKEPVLVAKEHNKEVYCVDWSHGGNKNLVVSGSWDRLAKVWDMQAGKCINTFEGHFGVVYSTIWCPQSTETFASTSDGTARIWDLRSSHTPTQMIGAHETETLSCDWSKYDQNILVTGSVDCSVRVWDLRNTRHFLCQMLGHSYAVRRVRCSPFSASCVASCSYDFTVRLWDFMKPQGLSPLLETISHHTEFVYGLDQSTFVPGLVADCAWDEHIRIYRPNMLRNTSTT